MIMAIVLKSLILLATAAPLLFLARRPTRAVCPARARTYSLTVSPESEGVLYTAAE